MQISKTVEERVQQQLGNFLSKSNIQGVVLRPDTDLINDAGLSSLQSLEFVLDLCDEFEVDFPADFNPFVNDQKRKGQKFKDLVKEVERRISNEGAGHGKK